MKGTTCPCFVTSGRGISPSRLDDLFPSRVDLSLRDREIIHRELFAASLRDRDATGLFFLSFKYLIFLPFELLMAILMGEKGGGAVVSEKSLETRLA